jgi:hypothetical protein
MDSMHNEREELPKWPPSSSESEESEEEEDVGEHAVEEEKSTEN